MSELNDSSDLQIYSSAVLYVLSAVSPPVEYIAEILRNFVTAIKSSKARPTIHSMFLGLTTNLVMADPPPCFTSIGRLFLQKPFIYLSGRRLAGDGGSACLLGR
jgi:hypothetical protein